MNDAYVTPVVDGSAFSNIGGKASWVDDVIVSNGGIVREGAVDNCYGEEEIVVVIDGSA